MVYMVVSGSTMTSRWPLPIQRAQVAAMRRNSVRFVVGASATSLAAPAAHVRVSASCTSAATSSHTIAVVGRLRSCDAVDGHGLGAALLVQPEFTVGAEISHQPAIAAATSPLRPMPDHIEHAAGSPR